MAKWTRQPQEQTGTYFFSGTFYATKLVNSELPLDELMFIFWDIRAFVLEKNGIDYFQVYTDENGRKLYFIDQLNEEMIRSGNFLPEDNHATLLFSHEY